MILRINADLQIYKLHVLHMSFLHKLSRKKRRINEFSLGSTVVLSVPGRKCEIAERRFSALFWIIHTFNRKDAQTQRILAWEKCCRNTQWVLWDTESSCSSIFAPLRLCGYELFRLYVQLFYKELKNISDKKKTLRPFDPSTGSEHCTLRTSLSVSAVYKIFRYF